jgi:hypothetical protein
LPSSSSLFSSSSLQLVPYKYHLNQRDHNADRQCECLDNLAKFNTINNKLLNPPGTPLRNIPLKIYLPTTSALQSSGAETEVGTVQASVRTVQGLIAPFSATTRKCASFFFFAEADSDANRSTKYTGYGVESNPTDRVS